MVGPDHLLLGLLANPRGRAYAALTEHGLSLDAAREIVVPSHVERHVDPVDEPEPGEEPETSAYDDDREALRAIGIDLDRVRDAVRANLGQDLGDGWGDRPVRRRQGRDERSRGRRGGRHHHERGEGFPGRGRRGPRSGRLRPSSRSLRMLLHDVRRSVQRDRVGEDDRRDVTGMTGARLLVALLRSDDEAVRAVLATAQDLDGLRAQAERAARPTAV